MDDVTESGKEVERKGYDDSAECVDGGAWPAQNGKPCSSGGGHGNVTAVNGGSHTSQCKRENSYDSQQCSFMEIMNSGLSDSQLSDRNRNFLTEGQGGTMCSPRGQCPTSYYGHPAAQQHGQTLTSSPQNQCHFEGSYQDRGYQTVYSRQTMFPYNQGRFPTPPSDWLMRPPYQGGQGQAQGQAGNLVQMPQPPRASFQTDRTTPSFPMDRQIKQEVDSLCSGMSLWAKTQQLSADSLKQVQNVYGQQFPLEVRHFFAQWIEEQPWKDLDEANPGHDQYALQLLDGLLSLMEAKAEDNDMDFLARLNLRNTAKHFRDWYSENPMKLVRIVKTCLTTEEALVNKETAHPDSMEHQGLINEQYIYDEIKRTIELLEEKTTSTEQDLRRMQLDQEKFVIDYQKNLKITNSITALLKMPQDRNCLEALAKLKEEKEENDRQLIAAAQQLLHQRLELALKHKDILTMLDQLQKRVVDDELIKWKRCQQLFGNGAEFDHSRIDTIQNWCESLSELIWRNRRNIIQVDIFRNQLPINVPQGVEDIQPELNKIVTGLLSSLVTSTFIVEHQPPQVLKKDARFTATVRLLVGGKLNLQMTPPRVKATIISEQQARGLLQSDENRRTQKCGEILNNEAPMDYHQHSGQLSICFRNMSLKNIKRADRRGADVHTVAEEKFCILFSSDFNVGGNELNFQVWTLSLPVVVTVHGNQECQATATYLWDNQFSEPGRTPFMVPDKVPWMGFAQMLSTKFQSMTGRGLSDDNLKYLAHKLTGQTVIDDLGQMAVTWTQFNKENITGRNFTFWEWFWSIGKLVKEHLKGPWNDGSIHGFIEKNESQEKLMARPNGTFLIRFSDGTLGGVTIAWVAENHEIGGERQVWNLHPFTIKDFSIRGLADRVKDLKSLVYLYPDKPKDIAFHKYYAPMTEPGNHPPGAYVKTTLITVIDSPMNAAPMNMEDPQTPQAYNEPFSPANSMTQKGDTASLMDSTMHEESVDFQNIASPDNSLDDFGKQLNDFLQSNHWG